MDNVNAEARSVKVSKVFKVGISTLLDELKLAIYWNRPSLLLAVHRSQSGLEKAQKALEKALKAESVLVVPLEAEVDRPDIIHRMEEYPRETSTVFFVTNVSAGADVYRAMNLFREVIVERSIRVVFWLTNKEAAELPHRAPDFWAFRHRVVEFSSPRKTGRDVPAPGLLMWNSGLQLTDVHSLEERIQFHLNMLEQIPNEGIARLQYAELSLDLSRLYWLQGQLTTSEKIVDDVLGSGDSGDEIIHARLLNVLGILQYSRGHYKEAVASFQKAIERTSTTEWLLANLGLARFAAGQKKRALDDLGKAIKLNPNSSWLWMLSGYLLAYAGRYEEALDPLKKAVEFDDTNFYAFCGVAYIHRKMFRMDLLDGIMQIMDEKQVELSDMYTVCSKGLAGSLQAGLDELRDVAGASVSFARLGWDPALNLVFGNDNLQSFQSLMWS